MNTYTNTGGCLISQEHYDARQQRRAKLSEQDRAALDNELARTASQGRAGTIRQCLEEGADPNARVFSGRPALLVAAWAGYEDTTRVLLEGRASVHLQYNGWDALTSALARGHERTAIAIRGYHPNDLDETMREAMIESCKQAPPNRRPYVIRWIENELGVKIDDQTITQETSGAVKPEIAWSNAHRPHGGRHPYIRFATYRRQM